ncbi:hypothetical protein [Coleofasciculus sp. E1-EBD-02]|uniref:hypothetical protein n=1 Tax=Coleofasciculus sp. E1-EBD-02 TaxID=3068481 RepID=UPI0033006D61
MLVRAGGRKASVAATFSSPWQKGVYSSSGTSGSRGCLHQYRHLCGNAIASSQDSATTNLAGDSVSLCPCLPELPILCTHMYSSTSRTLSIILPSLS